MQAARAFSPGVSVHQHSTPCPPMIACCGVGPFHDTADPPRIVCCWQDGLSDTAEC